MTSYYLFPRLMMHLILCVGHLAKVHDVANVHRGPSGVRRVPSLISELNYTTIAIYTTIRHDSQHFYLYPRRSRTQTMIKYLEAEK